MPTSPCPLCGSDFAAIDWKASEAQWIVDCPRCSRFTIDAYLMDVIRVGRAAQDDRVTRLLPWLSQAAQDAWQDGRRLKLVGETWQAIAHDAKQKHEQPQR